MSEHKDGAGRSVIVKGINKCSDLCEKAGIALATASGFIMLFSLLAGVITRWLPFTTTVIWSEEIARMCMLWLTANGASVAYRRSELVNFNLLVDLFSERVRYLLQIVSYIFISVVLVVLLRDGFDMLLLKMRVKAAATHISYFWWALGLYIGFVLMAVHTLKFFVDYLGRWKRVMKGDRA